MHRIAPGRHILTFVLLAFMAMTTPAGAQSTGTIEGQITGDEGQPLAGAMVRVLEQPNVGAISSENGRFRIQRVAPGNVTVEASLIGFQSLTASAQVRGGEVARVLLSLEVSPLALEGIIVQGQVGQAEALNRQRTAASVRSVVSSEQIERFPDAQVPDALRRIPGVSSRPDRGETGYIYIRGLSPNLVTVTIDGTRIPSTAQEGRGVELSSIPSEMLASVEVIKAITPDMDADAVAGSINLQGRRPTASQFDGRIEGGSHSLAGGSTYRGGLTYADSKGPFAYVLGGDYASQVRSTENTQYTWGTWQNQTVLNRLLLQQYPIERSRYSVNGGLSYALNEASSLFLRGFYSRYDTEEERHRLLYRADRGTRQSLTEATNARTYRQARQYRWEREIWDFTAGGDHTLGNGMGLDYYGSLSTGRRTEPYRNYFYFEQRGVDMVLDPTRDRLFPELRVTNGKDVNNLSDFRMTDYEWRLDHARDNGLGAGVNLSIPFEFGSGSLGSFKLGGRFTGRDKERDTSEAVLDQIAGTFTMAQLGTASDARAITSKRYPMGRLLDWTKGSAFYEENRNAFSGDPDEAAEAAHIEDYVAGEKVTAAYGMTTLDIGRLQVVAGARYEHTSLNYDGKRLIFDGSGRFQQVVPSNASSSYGSFFPALHLKYRLSEATNLRFAATRTISRPDFLQLAPNEYVRFDDEVVRRGNPDLRPTTSANVDLLFEHYLASVGLVQAGVFYKGLRDFAFTSRSIISTGPQAGFELLTPANGAEATVYGAEVASQQRLAFLPGALNGLGVYTNYTWVRSETDLDFRTGVVGARNARLPDQFDHVANVALTYDLGGFSGLVAANYQSNFVDRLGSSPDDDRMGRHRTQIDANFSQQITPNLRAILQLNNITNAPYTRYTGTMDTPYENEFEGFWGSFGLRFNLR
jgi:TonB-dependent receptor